MKQACSHTKAHGAAQMTAGHCGLSHNNIIFHFCLQIRSRSSASARSNAPTFYTLLGDVASASKTGAMLCKDGVEHVGYLLGGQGGKQKSFIAADKAGQVLLHVYKRFAGIVGETAPSIDPVLGDGRGSGAGAGSSDAEPSPEEGASSGSPQPVRAPLAWVLDASETVGVPPEQWSLSEWAVEKLKIR